MRPSHQKSLKFKKRKDRYSFIDYDSPYAEYLPARFKEWAPANLDTDYKSVNNSRIGEKLQDLTHIYA
ncbi:hypothetical protein COB52_05140 [Candidatus Kaiserbacteria bacterium]|nr:MAG: hypothetical protein COB52_05140 [Candidatus Kaiserbacteria bacterium]